MATGLLSPIHIALLAAIVLLIFGGRGLPALGRRAGAALRGMLRPAEPAELPPPKAPVTPGSPVARHPASTALAVGAAVARQRWAVRVLVRVLPPPLRFLARLLVR